MLEKESPLPEVFLPSPAAGEREAQLRGVSRGALEVAVGIASIFGTYAALAWALLFAEAHINQLLAAVARFSPMPAMRMDIVCWRTEPSTQARSYLLVVAIVAAIALTHALVVRGLRQWRLALIAFETLVVVTTGTIAFRTSHFLGQAFLLGLLPMSALFAPFVLPTRERAETVKVEPMLAVALALQAVPLGWGVWSTTFNLPTGAIVGAQIAAWSFSIWRTTARGAKEEEVLAGLPLTLLPIVGLRREPSVLWVVAALAAYAVLRLALRMRVPLTARLAGTRGRMPMTIADLAVVASFWGACAVVTIPYRFRDLPRLNQNSHETTAYGTVQSILHGKLMMADAGLVYGPLRSYALTLYMLVAGMTAEQIRLGQVLMNHAVLFVLLALGWRLVDRRLMAMLWYSYLLVVGTVVVLWVNYGGYGMNAFGWADLGRMGIPFLAMVGGIAALLDVTRDGALVRRDALRLARWGALAGIATLWAQEFGACAIVALGSVPLAHFLLSPGPLKQRARLAALSVGSLIGGTTATLLLWIGFYAIRGRAHLFLGNMTENSRAFASGSFGSLPFPTTEASFLRWEVLAGHAPHEGIAIEYVVPVAVYLFVAMALAARGLSGRWRERDAMTLGILAFGLASFRFVLGRTDFTHLMTATLPAVVLVARVAVEGTRAAYASRGATLLLRAGATGAALLLALASLNLSGVPLCLSQRLTAILAGTERPSSGPAYSYPNLARGGDTKIQPEYVALIEAIRANSAPADKIFQHIGYMDGGEVYFLADRTNPTRFDILTELITTGRQETLAEELQKDPPKLVVGEDWGVTGDAANKFLKENYHSIGKFGGFDLLTKN